MSQTITALAVGYGTRFTAQIPQASHSLEISKRGDLSSMSSGAAYVHLKSHPLICKRPLNAGNKQCSFVAFAMQSDKTQNGNYRRMTKQQEKIHHRNMNVTKSHKLTEEKGDLKDLIELLERFQAGSNGRKEKEKKMDRKHINAKQYNRNDMQDDWEYLQPEIQANSPEDLNYPKERHKSKSSSTDESTLREIVLLEKSKLKSEKGHHGEGQRIQMSDDKAERPVNSLLRVLQQGSNPGTVVENSSQKFAAFSRNGKSRTRTLKSKFSQYVVPENNSIQKSSLNNKLGFERPPSNDWRKSPIAAPLVSQQEQVAYVNSQLGDTEPEDYSFHVGQGNKMQLESEMEYAAPDYDDLLMPDTSSITAAKTMKSESLINGTPGELSDNSSVEAKDFEFLMNGKVRQKSKCSSTDESIERRIVDLVKKTKSKSEEGSHGEGQRIQMSDDQAEGSVDSLLKVLRRYSNQGAVVERPQKFAAFSRNGKSIRRNLKSKLSQFVVRQNNSMQKSSLTNKLAFERPPSNIWCNSPIAVPVVRQQEQVVYANSQSGDTDPEDYSLNVGQGNKMQLESEMEYAAPDYDELLIRMPDISSNTAVKTTKSESLINGTPVELSDTLSNSSVEARDSEFLMNGAEAHPSLLIEQKDLSTLKLSDLKIIAKSRGLKGFSNFKKAELLDLLIINDTPVELSDTSSNSSVEDRDSEFVMNGAGAHPSLLIEQKDLSTLKLSDLKIIAKSRGLQGFSKLKKVELLDLLMQGTN